MNVISALKNLLISLLVLTSVLFVSQISKSYDDKTTHPGLTDEIVDFYNLSYPNEQLTNEEKEWIVRGSIDEDTPPRWINHFYDPINKVGWSGENTGIWPTMVVQYFSTRGISSHEPVSSLFWLHAQDLQAQYGQYKGNRTWERAIYEAVKNKDKKEAYYTLGFILHLIEDATVPDHTRNDTHAHELRYGTFDYGSPYEEFAKQFTRQNLKIAEELKNKNKQPVVKSSIDEYLISLAEYSNKYFFSKDTISNEKYKYPDLKEIKEKDGFGYGKDENGEEFELVLAMKIKLGDYDILTHYSLLEETGEEIIMPAYFSRLSRRAILSGGGIINLFKQEVAKAEKEKSQNLPQESSSVFSPTGRLYQFTGYISAVGNFISNQLDNFKNSLPSNIVQALNNANEQFQNNKQDLGTMSLLLVRNQIAQNSQKIVNQLVDLEPLPQPQPTQPQVETNNPQQTETNNSQPTINNKKTEATDNRQPPQQLAQNNFNAVPWPGYVFAPPAETNNSQQTETNNSQLTTDNAEEETDNKQTETSNSETAPEPEPEPQDTTPPSIPQITSHQNNQYLNKTADEIPNEPQEETDNAQEENENEQQQEEESEQQYQEGVQITFKGTTDPDSVVLISANLAAKELSEITPDSSGIFEYQTTLQEGENIFEFAARDAVGNISETETLTLILDLTAPESIADLQAEAGQNRGKSSLTFTKPNDNFGVAKYEIRYSQKSIVKENPEENETTFENAEFSQILNSAENNQESIIISGLNPGQKYYFAAKSIDLAGNESEVSNIAETKPNAKAEHLVISEFKIEGDGNAYDDESIELYNPTAQDISLDGWSIQYIGSRTAKFESIDKKNFEKEHKIPAHGFFLIAKNQGYRGSTPPDMSHTSFSLSARLRDFAKLNKNKAGRDRAATSRYNFLKE